MKTKAIPIVMVALIGVCIFASIVSAETAEEWNEKGVSFAVSGEYKKAIECFDKAIELNPNDRGVTYHEADLTPCTGATKGESYTGNPYVRFDEGTVVERPPPTLLTLTGKAQYIGK